MMFRNLQSARLTGASTRGTLQSFYLKFLPPYPIALSFWMKVASISNIFVSQYELQVERWMLTL